MGLGERDPGLEPSTWGPSQLRAFPLPPRVSTSKFTLVRCSLLMHRQDCVLASSLLRDAYPENESADGGD